MDCRHPGRGSSNPRRSSYPLSHVGYWCDFPSRAAGATMLSPRPLLRSAAPTFSFQFKWPQSGLSIPATTAVLDALAKTERASRLQLYGSLVSSNVRKAENGKSYSHQKWDHKGQFRRTRLRPIVCRAWAGQGCPILTKRFAPVVRFAAPPLTSPVPTWDWALRDCAPGILAGRNLQVFTAAGWLTS